MKKGAGLYLGFLYFQDREDGIDDIDDIILELEDFKRAICPVSKGLGLKWNFLSYFGIMVTCARYLFAC
jgi:hypothetical protein